jgi:hypothetical protein
VTAALVAGCTPDRSKRAATRTPAPRHSPSTDPDVRLAATVLEHERAMLDRVSATIQRHPRLGATLASTRAAHRSHVALLTKAVPNDTPYHSPAPADRNPARVPRRAPRALAALAAAEHRLADVGARNSLAARSGPFARLLASMSAAASQQGVRLVAAAAGRG